jgi:hypothetical protein
MTPLLQVTRQDIRRPKPEWPAVILPRPELEGGPDAPLTSEARQPMTHLGQHLRIAAFETMLTTLGSLDQIAAMQ